MSHHILWNDWPVSFVEGETLAQALLWAGIPAFGTGAAGQDHSVFCGIGQCQNCLVMVAGQGYREACLTPCRDGLVARSIGPDHA